MYNPKNTPLQYFAFAPLSELAKSGKLAMIMISLWAEVATSENYPMCDVLNYLDSHISKKGDPLILKVEGGIFQ